MSFSCWCCRFHRCISWARLLTCPLCSTSGAGRDCAQNCGGFRSCSSSACWSDVYGGLRTSCSYFPRGGELVSGGRFSLWKSGFHEPFVSGSHCVFLRQLRRLLESLFFYVKWARPDIDSPGGVRTLNLDIIPTSFLRTSEGRVPIFQPSMTKSSSSSRAGVAGTPGVGLPGVLPHQFGACLRRYGKTHRRWCLVRSTTSTPSPSLRPRPPPSLPPSSPSSLSPPHRVECLWTTSPGHVDRWALSQ